MLANVLRHVRHLFVSLSVDVSILCSDAVVRIQRTYLCVWSKNINANEPCKNKNMMCMRPMFRVIWYIAFRLLEYDSHYRPNGGNAPPTMCNCGCCRMKHANEFASSSSQPPTPSNIAHSDVELIPTSRNTQSRIIRITLLCWLCLCGSIRRGRLEGVCMEIIAGK